MEKNRLILGNKCSSKFNFIFINEIVGETSYFNQASVHERKASLVISVDTRKKKIKNSQQLRTEYYFFLASTNNFKGCRGKEHQLTETTTRRLC